MKKPVIALKMHTGKLKQRTNIDLDLHLPKGCVGICFVFESKKTAREYWGKDTPLVEVEKQK